jgi:hypothetical protein
MLTAEQRACLEERGLALARMKLIEYSGNRETVVGGFPCEYMKRGDLEDWVAEKGREEARQQTNILLWAKIAAGAGIIGVIVTAIGIWLQKK